MKEKILALLSQIEGFNKDDSNTMPGNVYYLNDKDILCLERDYGESRYPYEMDGRNLWVHSSGHINAVEGKLTIFKNASYLQEENSIDFWGGIKLDDGWYPVSITGVSKQLYEAVPVKRYIVYSKRAAYLIADTDKITFALRASIQSTKAICFTTIAINKTNEAVPTYIIGYINPHISYTLADGMWSPMYRHGKVKNPSSTIIWRRLPAAANEPPMYSIINRLIKMDSEYQLQSTVSKLNFLGEPGRCLVSAKALKDATFTKEIHSVNSIDFAINADIISFNLNPSATATIAYTMDVAYDENSADKLSNTTIDLDDIAKDIIKQEQLEANRLSGIDISFDKSNTDKLNGKLFNRFLTNVQRQIDICAFGKNYVGEMLGIRDVFQQLTAATIWNKDDVRKKIILCLNYIISNGRSPRQIVIQDDPNATPKFDIRQFIDQGLWIIETVHKYLSRTNDFSILNESCTYYDIIDEKNGIYKKSDITDSVLEHLIKITDYLNSNIDSRTGCLKSLYGDWNDAISGLGVSSDGSAEFGTGCSIMATLQHYKLLKEMAEILERVGGYDEKCTQLLKIRDGLAKGLTDFAIQNDGSYRMILHGWGDMGSYNVGSLCDTDGEKRYSLNPYSFWCISDLIAKDLTYKKDILHTYEVLDFKYGIKTFDKPFPRDMKGVGRIADITPGTAENSNTYVHATTFAIMALFIIGEDKKAWEQILKILPITHKRPSKTPFVMPNSYCHNDEYQIDGESYADWYTGSGAVLYRCIYEYALGIRAQLDGVELAVPNYVPFNNIKLDTVIKGKNIHYTYSKNEDAPHYYVNGALQEATTDPVSGYKKIFIQNKDICDGMVIEIK